MTELDRNNIPQHVAIIMDGNGRWAKQQIKQIDDVLEVDRAAREYARQQLAHWSH